MDPLVVGESFDPRSHTLVDLVTDTKTRGASSGAGSPGREDEVGAVGKRNIIEGNCGHPGFELPVHAGVRRLCAGTNVDAQT